MELLHRLFFTLVHLNPQNVNALADYLGPGLYLVLFAIVFCETGLVVTPFLPGDSLLFAVGAVAAIPGSTLGLVPLGIMLCVAANLGDLLNYSVGRRLGPAVFSRDSKLLNKKHLREAHEFYERHGRKTIILARFVPIIRTFAPFVAGVGQMSFVRFISFSIVGGAVWVWAFLCVGYMFGTRPAVQKNFHLVVLGIVVISVLPAAYHWWVNRRKPTVERADALPRESVH